MDLNKLYFSHQVAMMRASAADDGQVRTQHRALASAIAERIVTVQDRLGAGAAAGWTGVWHSPTQWRPGPVAMRAGPTATSR